MVRSFSTERIAGADAGAVETIKHAATRVAVILVCFLASASIASAADNVIKSSYETVAKFLRSLGNSDTINQIVRLKNDGRPFTLHVSPSERSAITARLEPPTRYVEIFKGCIEGWCHVHLGLAAGWIRKDRLRLSEPQKPRNEQREVRNENNEVRSEDIADEQGVSVASVNNTTSMNSVNNAAPANIASVPLPIRKDALPPVIQQVSVPPLPAPEPPPPAEQIAQTVASLPFRKTTERNIALPPSNVVNTSLKLSEIPRKPYSLTNVEDMTFLLVREDRSDDARILGGIRYFANNVEALGLCVDEWCLVRYGEELRGWVRQYHLSDTHREKPPRLKLQNVKEQTAVALYDEPDQQAEVATYLDLEATGIVPTGTCDLDWCHVLHDGKTGWIQSTYLARQ